MPVALVVLFVLIGPFYGNAQTDTENWVMTLSYKTPVTNTVPATQSQTVQTQIGYIDGLGRPIQQVSHKQGGNGSDLITHIEYDALGRQVKNYLPYPRTSSNLNMEGSASGDVLTFYNSPEFQNTANPYTESDLEKSPRSRPLREAAPGNDWAMGSGHEVKYGYRYNQSDEVYLFELSYTGSLPQLSGVSHYDANQLSKSIIYDENNIYKSVKGSVVTYTDKNGRVVLKRHYTTATGRFSETDPNAAIAMDTYYVYDPYGNLAMVLPPLLMEKVVVDGVIVGNHVTLVDNLGYRYAYDDRNRLIRKKLPGRQMEFLWYDKLDRPIGMGPVKSPFGDEGLGIIITKYDQLDRVAYTLWRPGWFGENTLVPPAEPIYISEYRTTGTQINGVTVGYTNNVEPQTGVHVLTVNYYDDYGWPGAPTGIPSTVGQGDISVGYNNSPGNTPKGLPTGGWVRILEGTSAHDGKVSYTLYDEKARPVRDRVDYPGGGYTQVDTQYDFVGKVLYTLTKHRRVTNDPLQTVKEEFEYDAQQRLVKHTHKVNTNPTRLLAHHTYDALGQLKAKKTGGTDVSAATYLQKVDYTYNVRGWMTDINNVNSLNTNPVDLFALKINYNGSLTEDVNGAVRPLYNGNISELSWRSSSDDVKRHYSFSYDYQNRLLDAWYSKPNAANPLSQEYNEQLTYDLNGNILTLKRNGAYELGNPTPIDDLAYSYFDDSNRLRNVADGEGHPDGFDDGTATNPNAQEYGYDGFGNLVSDANKGIAQISYNHLGLPVEVDFGSGDRVSYLYTADGLKLEKKVEAVNQSPVRTAYVDGFQYSQEGTALKLDFLMHAEGSVEVTHGSFGSVGYNYVYHYLDHLGNLRVRYAVDPSDGELKILEENHYYPFGLRHTGYNQTRNSFKNLEGTSTIVLTTVDPFLGDSFKYGFNGKEEQNELGLDWHDFGARNYDASLGRWMNVDPLAEKYRDMSSYAFVANNPLVYVDPDGKQIAPGSQKEFDKQKKDVIAQRDKLQGKIDGLNAKAAEKGWSSKKLANRIGNMQDRVNGLNSAISNLGVLESSKQVYSLDSGASQNGVSFDNSTGEIVISYSGTALFTHETTHAGQFETGDIAFDSATGNTLAQDVQDEVAGYKAQWAYDPSSVGGLKSQNQITPSWVQGVTDPATGNQPYKPGGAANTGISPINVNSTRDDLIKAYPHLRSSLKSLPASSTLKSIVPTLYTKNK